jgi:hypothetical protein
MDRQGEQGEQGWAAHARPARVDNAVCQCTKEQCAQNVHVHILDVCPPVDMTTETCAQNSKPMPPTAWRGLACGYVTDADIQCVRVNAHARGCWTPHLAASHTAFLVPEVSSE